MDLLIDLGCFNVLLEDFRDSYRNLLPILQLNVEFPKEVKYLKSDKDLNNLKTSQNSRVNDYYLSID